MFIASLGIYKKLSRNRSRAIARYIAPLIGEHQTEMLDFGGGNLYLVEELYYIKPKLNITAIDVIEDQNLSRALLDQGLIKFKVYNSKEIPFADNSFDVAVASAVMHHTPDPEYYLEELKRVIKPGGSILLVEEMYHHVFDKMYISTEDFILNRMKKGVPVPLNFRPYKHYKALFERLNLEVAFEGHVYPSFPYKHHYVFKLVKQ